MNFLRDVISYVRRIVKTPSNAVLSDALIIDYINRFWIMDVDARIQIFDLKTKYQFQTTPGWDRYNMPLYNIQVEPGQNVGMYPVYQGFTSPAYINGIQVPLYTQKNSFFNMWPNVVQPQIALAVGNNTRGPYTLNLPIAPGNQNPINPPVNGLIRGHIDTLGIIGSLQIQDPPIATNSNIANVLALYPTTSIDSAVFITATASDGTNIIVQDSGIFRDGSQNLGFLMNPGAAPFGNSVLSGGYGESDNITGIAAGVTTVLTAVNTFTVGMVVLITGVVGMTQLNGRSFTITAVTATTVTLNVDSTAFSAYISGGTVSVVQNFVNYLTGQVTVFFDQNIPAGSNINVQCNYFQSGLPRGILFYNNTLTFRSPPANQYLVELDAYLSPSAYLSSEAAVPFAYMSEYIARGAARKILSDTGDVEQFMFYEPLFKEQELLVWKRSQRQWTNNRTETIYSHGLNGFGNANSSLGGGTI